MAPAGIKKPNAERAGTDRHEERSLAAKTLQVELAKRCRGPAVLILAVVLVAGGLAAASTVMAQTTTPPDPLDLYDANDDGVIDADELITAVSDHFAGRIDRAMAVRVLNLYLASDAARTETPGSSTSGCYLHDRYDNVGNDNDLIDRDEVIAAIRDYFNDLIDRDNVIGVIKCYFSGKPTTTIESVTISRSDSSPVVYGYVTLTATVVPTSTYDYTWQYDNGVGWQDLTNNTFQIEVTADMAGAVKFQVLVGHESGSTMNSDDLTITWRRPPIRYPAPTDVQAAIAGGTDKGIKVSGPPRQKKSLITTYGDE